MRRINNQDARRVFLAAHELGGVPKGSGRGDDLYQLIRKLGFVQLDSIRTVERAHDMILYARRPSYRPKHLWPLLSPGRKLFEHWTHDAALLPMEFYPHWHMRFERDRVRLAKQWRNWHRDDYEAKYAPVLAHIEQHGACGTSDLGADEKRSSGGWWDWNPSKTALEYLWRTGTLTISKREGFKKVYDLTDRIVPSAIRDTKPNEAETINWLNLSALERMAFGTAGEIAAFWDTLRPHEVKDWLETALDQGLVEEIEVESVDGTWRRSFALPSISHQLDTAPPPPKRIRILSPFDPAIRDRKRTERLFGFHYRIEIFVPEAKREYGYYVFPIMENDALIGRIDAKANRKAGTLDVTAVWPERKVRFGSGRIDRLNAELIRFARFAGLESVSFANDWLRAPK